MAHQPIDHGNAAGDGQGESLFTAFQKVNENDVELYAGKAAAEAFAASKAAAGGIAPLGADALLPIGNMAGFVLPVRNALKTIDLSTQPFELAKISTSWKLNSIPSPYSPAHVLHPSVLFFDSGWRGYRYWMAYTPYPNSDSEFENPCMAVSNDLETWVAMGAQPLVASPAGVGTYNSDTDLYFDEPNDRLVMLFRESGVPNSAVTKLFVMTTSDGVTWTTPTQIYQSANAGTASATDIASPSIWYNDTTSKWEIVGHNVKDNASAWPFVKITSSSLLFGWDAAFTVLTFDVPAVGRKWWHSQFRRTGDGKIIGVIQDNSGSVGNAGNLYLARSDDGAAFYSGLLDNSKSWYRPSFLVLKGADDKPRLKVFGSQLTTSGIWTADAEFNIGNCSVKMTGNTGGTYYDSDEGITLGSLFGAARGGARGILIADDFNRVDSAAGVGNSIDAKTWTQFSGTDLVGISGNRAYNVTAGNCKITYDTGYADYVVRATVAQKNSESYIVVRGVDNSNFIRIGVPSSSGTLAYRVIIGGIQVIDEALGTTLLNGDEIKVLCRGEFILIFLRGSLVGVKRQASLKAGTKIGLQISGATSLIDNFVAARLY